MTALAAYFLTTGQLKRWHGYVLLGLYVGYWIVSYIVYGALPSRTNDSGTRGVPTAPERRRRDVALEVGPQR